MFKKTSNANFLLYGNPNSSFLDNKELLCQKIVVNDKKQNDFYSFDTDTYINIEDGIGMLIIYDKEYIEYYINKRIKIKKDVKYTIVPIDDKVRFSLYHYPNTVCVKYYIKNSYNYHNIEPSLKLSKIYSYSYGNVKNLDSDYKLNKYYELIFVDNGSCHMLINNEEIQLNQNDLCIIDLKNNHYSYLDSSECCNCLSIIFDSENPIDEKILNHLTHCPKNVLDLFASLFSYNNQNTFYRNDLFITTLQMIIINLLQNENGKVSSSNNQLIDCYYVDDLFKKIIVYINENLDKPLTIEYICQKFAISHGSLQNLFKENLNIPIKHYINDMRLRKSKELLKLYRYSLSDISSMLGFRSMYYFSKKFYENYGLTFNEYVKKIYPD